MSIENSSWWDPKLSSELPATFLRLWTVDCDDCIYDQKVTISTKFYRKLAEVSGFVRVIEKTSLFIETMWNYLCFIVFTQIKIDICWGHQHTHIFPSNRKSSPWISKHRFYFSKRHPSSENNNIYGTLFSILYNFQKTGAILDFKMNSCF